MAVENIPNKTPDELDESLPDGTDDIKEGDEHIRNIKAVLRNYKKWIPVSPESDQAGAGFGGFRHTVTEEDGKKWLNLFTS